MSPQRKDYEMDIFKKVKVPEKLSMSNSASQRERAKPRPRGLFPAPRASGREPLSCQSPASALRPRLRPSTARTPPIGLPRPRPQLPPTPAPSLRSAPGRRRRRPAPGPVPPVGHRPRPSPSETTPLPRSCFAPPLGHQAPPRPSSRPRPFSHAAFSPGPQRRVTRDPRGRSAPWRTVICFRVAGRSGRPGRRGRARRAEEPVGAPPRPCARRCFGAQLREMSGLASR